jgi:two-component system sensor histidine kinase PhoQ
VAADSVSRRLLLSVAAPLLLFLGVTTALLDQRFRRVADDAVRSQLDGQMVALIAASDPDEAGAVKPSLQSAEERLRIAGSGLYARIINRRGLLVWRSPSSVGTDIPFGGPLPPGESLFSYQPGPDGSTLAIVSRGLRFEDDRRRRIDLTFTVVMSLDPYQAQLRQFRQDLFSGFAALAAALLVTLGLLLHWALRPLRTLGNQILELESGARTELDDAWPRELARVVANLNGLLRAERDRITRYRNTLGNLAHSLKTPLAVMRSSLGGDSARVAETVDQQVDRMSAIIDHQLKRAARGASGGSNEAVAVLPVVQDLRGAVMRAFGRKDFLIELQVEEGASFLGDRDDLLETLGNLMENGAKWCRSTVRVSAGVHWDVGKGRRLLLRVEDDGPGIATPDRDRVLQRGVRADEHTPGHGLGLAMVQDVVRHYGGSVRINGSALGGACLELDLPAP